MVDAMILTDSSNGFIQKHSNSIVSHNKKKDEPDYQSFEQASKLIEQALTSDEKYPELYEQLLDQTEPHNYFIEPYQTYWKPQIVRKGGINEVPSAIISAYEHLKCLSMAGILPEIHHAWTSIDNMLFLWDYTKKEKFCIFDGMDQVIVSVGLATPKQDVFKDFVEHVLVIATPVEVALVAIVYDKNDRQNGEIKLRSSNLTISTDNIIMRKIVGTNKGRIFMGGSDGGLHEFVYDAEEGFLYQLGLQKKCRKIDHTGVYLRYIPTFLRPDSQLSGKIVDLVVDEERNILFTLSSSSAIAVYDLSMNGMETNYIISKNVFTEAQKFCRQYQRSRSTCPDEQYFKNLPATASIVSLSIVPRKESSYVHIVATSNTGIRFYFSTYSRNAYSVGQTISLKVRPTDLKIVHIRLPPPAIEGTSVPEYHVTEGMQPAYVPGQSPSHVHTAFYRQGVFLMANGAADHHDNLLGVAQDFLNRSVNVQATNRKPVLRESISSDSCHGKIWSIMEYEIPSNQRKTNKLHIENINSSKNSEKKNEKETQGPISNKRQFSDISSEFSTPSQENPCILGELSLQYSTPQRLFMCLTNAGMLLFKKLRPIDQLHRILVYHRNDSSQLENFFRYYGQTQVCCMLFAIACSVPTDPGILDANSDGQRAGSSFQTDELVRSDALRAIFEFGGSPGVADYSPSYGPGSGRLVMTDDLFLSGHHDGLLMFFSRVVRPFWLKTFLIISKNSIKTNQIKKSTFDVHGRCTRAELKTIREILFQLKQIMEQAAPYSMAIQCTVSEMTSLDSLAPSRGNTMTRMLNVYSNKQNADQVRQERALKAEQRSIQCIYKMLIRTIEGLSLLLIALENPSILNYKRYHRMTFSELILTTEGSSCAHSMIHRILQEILKEPGKVDNFVGILRRECPSFFSVGDVWQYQGHQMLLQAKSILNPHQRQELLDDALKQFIKACSYWKYDECIEMLKRICRDFIYMRFFDGVVTIALQCAQHGISLDSRKIPLPEYSLSSKILNSWKTFLKTSSSSSSTTTSSSSISNGIKQSKSHDDESSQILYRMECYNHILSLLYVLIGSKSGETILDTFDGWPTMSTSERERSLKKVLNISLASEDALFHQTLYNFLLENEQNEYLVEVRSPFIEEFLQRENNELLCNFYVRQGRYADAALVMWNKSHYIVSKSSDKNPIISERLQYLTRALSYAQSATSFGNSTTKTGTTISANTISEIREKLDVVQLQLNVFNQLESETNGLKQRMDNHDFQSSDQLKERQEDLKNLKYNLIDVSSLYNAYAVKYCMWEQCLAIMHSCAAEDPVIINQHWKRIIYSIIPSTSISESNTEWIHEQKQQAGVVDERLSATFEDAAWIGHIQQKIRKLGRQLYGTGADFVFPLDLLTRELETLWLHFQESSNTLYHNENWILTVFHEANVSYMTLFESYLKLYHEQGSIQWKIHLLMVICNMIRLWKDEVSTSRTNRQDQIEFANSCPKLIREFEAFTTDLQAMRDDTGREKLNCLNELRQIKDTLSNYREVYFA